MVDDSNGVAIAGVEVSLQYVNMMQNYLGSVARHVIGVVSSWLFRVRITGLILHVLRGCS